MLHTNSVILMVSETFAQGIKTNHTNDQHC